MAFIRWPITKNWFCISFIIPTIVRISSDPWLFFRAGAAAAAGVAAGADPDAFSPVLAAAFTF